MAYDKIVERVILLRRFLPQLEQLTGWEFRARVYKGVLGLDYDWPKSIEELARMVDDSQLAEVFKLSPYRSYYSFRGHYYTVRGGELYLEDSWSEVKKAVWEAFRLNGIKVYALLKALMELGEAPFAAVAARASEILGSKFNPAHLLAQLRDRWEIVWESGAGRERSWTIPEEIRPVVEDFIKTVESKPIPRLSTRQAEDEFVRVLEMESEYNSYLGELLRERLDETIEFGRGFSVQGLVEYLVDLFGREIYFDELLTLAQQYSLTDTPVVTESGHRSMTTGFNLALFGEPGTGKTFATKDFIVGNESLGVLAHGLPGLNRYCGGMTPAMFIAIGEAYAGRRFNFIVTEFNDWFKHRGMVEPLKLALEGGVIAYETKTYRVGPYRFSSFFSVNYNTRVFERGYQVTVSDPNFNAIEDRMLCRLHRLTKEKYRELAESQKRLMLGVTTEKMARMAPRIRDHLTLVHAIQTGHPATRDFSPKRIILRESDLAAVTSAREAMLEAMGEFKVLPFSMRLERRAVQLASSLTLASYFNSDSEELAIDPDALRLAVRFYVEEAWIRAGERFDVKEVLRRLNLA
ncbi:hypothetical protein IG193_00055 [Infirmifilum lucidum]|uniref:Uncharacterized protein n=1 Tax=Infirmifilum lucidum TaxID=2776706 RepID=A0A7L9FGQ6_9CREN|nr:hypothetical protein [Infirmifilum lucidum]QOJ78897.1 hypothetical protein IG193_00055 [Infirmifilum lucidum]